MKTKFENNMVAVFVLLVLAMCTISPTVSAFSYSPMEAFFETTLVDPQLGLNIKTADVAIGTSQVIIDYTTHSSSLEEAANDIAGIVGVYKTIVNDYPEVGDLLILTRSNFGGNPTRFSCQKSWVSGLPDVYDADAFVAVVRKVVETGKT